MNPVRFKTSYLIGGSLSGRDTLACKNRIFFVDESTASQRTDMKTTSKLNVGWYHLHPDPALNFQLNRSALLGGPSWVAEVRPYLSRLSNMTGWIDTFVMLGNAAELRGDTLNSAVHYRSAEFFMLRSDIRKAPLRVKLLAMLREAFGVDIRARKEVPFGALRLPVWSFATTAANPRGTALVFGGFDGYIEEMFPMFQYMSEEESWNVIAFEGPGQGAVLEEQHAPMTPDWSGPVGAVLSALGLDGVTLIGISLGGCLAIRAAAFEPRVHRVVCFDVMLDMFECAMVQQRPPISLALRGLLAIGADRVVDEALNTFANSHPATEWGLAQAQHVFGKATPSEAIDATRAYNTRDVSHLIRQDVLLLAGAEDHYVPLEQLWQQARLLTSVRSVTTHVFTAEQDAQAHCQIGNLPLAITVFSEWAQSLDSQAGREPLPSQ